MKVLGNPFNAAALLAVTLVFAVIAAWSSEGPIVALIHLSNGLGRGLAVGGLIGLVVFGVAVVTKPARAPYGSEAFHAIYGRATRARFWFVALLAYLAGWLIAVLGWWVVVPDYTLTPFLFSLDSSATAWHRLGVLFLGQVPAAALAAVVFSLLIAEPARRGAISSWKAWLIAFSAPLGLWFVAEALGVAYDFGFINPDGSKPLTVLRESVLYTAEQIPNSLALVSERGYPARGLTLYAVLALPAVALLLTMSERTIRDLLGEATLNALERHSRALLLGTFALLISSLLGITALMTGRIWLAFQTPAFSTSLGS